jgi:hypothetical protein
LDNFGAKYKVTELSWYLYIYTIIKTN